MGGGGRTDLEASIASAGELHGDRLLAVADGIGSEDCRTVAGAVLGFADPVLVGPAQVEALTVHHYDSRTAGMLRVSGRAQETGGAARSWSAVIKVLDLSVPARANNFVDPEREVLVYRHALFAADGLPVRPARCYLVGKGALGTTLLWLEDLTGLRKPPFTLDALGDMAAHFGTWNARNALQPPSLPFEAGTNTFLVRCDRSPSRRLGPRLRELRQHPYTREAYRDVPVEAFDELVALAGQLNALTATRPGAICFGDCNVGNLFAGDGETVAVDWASLARDPVGLDAGCLIGSAATWGREGALVAAAERDLFDRYLGALREFGWQGSQPDVRRAFFALYSHYLYTSAAAPALLVDEVFPIHLMERRFSAGRDEIPALVAGVVALLPACIREMRALLEG